MVGDALPAVLAEINPAGFVSTRDRAQQVPLYGHQSRAEGFERPGGVASRREFPFNDVEPLASLPLGGERASMLERIGPAAAPIANDVAATALFGLAPSDRGTSQCAH